MGGLKDVFLAYDVSKVSLADILEIDSPSFTLGTDVLVSKQKNLNKRIPELCSAQVIQLTYDPAKPSRRSTQLEDYHQAYYEFNKEAPSLPGAKVIAPKMAKFKPDYGTRSQTH